jgi:hypothetical protein
MTESGRGCLRATAENEFFWGEPCDRSVAQVAHLRMRGDGTDLP